MTERRDLVHPDLKRSLPLLRMASNISKIDKGFSRDQKYMIDGTYLLRVFESENTLDRQKEFETIRMLAAYSDFIPKAVSFHIFDEIGLSCMVLTYLPGEDGEVALPVLAGTKQYDAGFQAGEELKKLHQLQAPANLPAWEVQKKQKSDTYLNALEELEDIDTEMKTTLCTYIRNHEYLLRARPQTIQHDDFHPANLLIHKERFAGIIDFQRMDWGDPVHDLHKLGFFFSRISVPFTRGVVDGYHAQTGVPETFWERYTLYSAMHVVSALVWGERIGSFPKMLAFSKDVLRDHDNFHRFIPKWYV
ncbi:phosphotransferase family protein [Virgibacillus halophilus]